MNVPAIGSITSGAGQIAAGKAGGAGGAGSSFTDALAKGIDALSAQEKTADSLVMQAATGGNVAPHDVLIATQKAEMTLQLAVAVRNKALEAYRDIMSMQL